MEKPGEIEWPVRLHKGLIGKTQGCHNCGSENLTTRDDSDADSGYFDPERPWCIVCNGWAD